MKRFHACAGKLNAAVCWGSDRAVRMLAFCMVLSAFPPFIFYCMLQLLRVGGGLYNSWHRLVHYSSSQPCRMQNCQSSRISNILGGVVALCELSSVQMFGSSNLLLQTCDCKAPYTIPRNQNLLICNPALDWQDGLDRNGKSQDSLFLYTLFLFAISWHFLLKLNLASSASRCQLTLADEAFAHEMLSGSRVAPHTSSLCSKAPVHSSLAEAVEADSCGDFVPPVRLKMSLFECLDTKA